MDLWSFRGLLLGLSGTPNPRTPRDCDADCSPKSRYYLTFLAQVEKVCKRTFRNGPNDANNIFYIVEKKFGDN